MTKAVTSFKYPGSKTNPGFFQFISNLIPETKIFIEGFAGSAIIAKTIATRATIILVEADPATEDKLKVSTVPGVEIHGMPFLLFCDRFPEFENDPQVVFYLDPPYPFLARKSKARLYDYEMSDSDHIALLKRILSFKAKVLISTRLNELYLRMLGPWYRYDFSTSDRGGAATEIVYTNFDPLHYPLLITDHIGFNPVERQFFKRQHHRIVAKFESIRKSNPHQFHRIKKSINDL